jgi:EKC/KEOPS complex subunit CGI121/TPRKB
VSDSSTALFVVRVDGPQIPAADVQDKMDAVVLGRIVPFTTLDNITDWSAIKKVSARTSTLAVDTTLTGHWRSTTN